MKSLYLVPVGEVDPVVLERLASELAQRFRVNCLVRSAPLSPGFAFELARNQFLSTAILGQLYDHDLPAEARVLGVTAEDLYIPVLTFVFGEAQVNNPCALVSLHRLREEFYGLPPKPELLQERLLKEAIHELGHTFGLLHCPDYRCVMTSSHSVERLDVKTADFCPACQRQLRLAGQEVSSLLG